MIEKKTFDAIVNLMDDDIRERVHSEVAPCAEAAFLKRYLELDPSFADALRQEFPEALDAAKDGEPRIFINKDTAVSYTLEELKDAFNDTDDGHETFEEFLDRETAWDGSLAVI